MEGKKKGTEGGKCWRGYGENRSLCIVSRNVK
jgi:hypothetical protein